MKTSLLAALIAGALATASHTAIAQVGPATAAPGGAEAGQPAIGPVPDWVKPVARPKPAPAVGEMPLTLLLSDQQIKFEPGRKTVYSDMVMRIGMPQGLAAGNISLPWRPDLDEVTVHKLIIRRGDSVIDVLASGQTFTVMRREQNLENATLDGVLTANIQPEGLQVGDTLEFAASVTSHDPTMGTHVEQITGDWNGVPIGRIHLSALWPVDMPLRLRQIGDLAALKPVTAKGMSWIELSQDNLQPILTPKGAPLRNQLGRFVELTDFASWSDLGTLMAPLYAKAGTLPESGPLHDELDRIRTSTRDPVRQAEAALELVQSRVRYVALAMGQGGYVPADAAETWSRRFGDCKGKTALLLGLLHALGIEAEPVAVNSSAGDGLDERLPMVGLFNHVLVRAHIDGKTYWMDGTRIDDTSLDRLRVPNFGWGLPLISEGAALVRMVPAPPEQPLADTTIHIDAHDGLKAPAPTKVETALRGDSAIAAKAAIANLYGEARDKALREYWKRQYDFIDIESVDARFDPQTGEQYLSMTGKARMEWNNGSYVTDGTAMGYRADFSRDSGVDKDAPFAVPYPMYVRTRETIVLPKGQGDFRPGSGIEVDETLGGIHYVRHATIAGNVFTIEASQRSVVPEFPASQASAAQTALRALAERTARLRQPYGYEVTDAEIAAARADTPDSATGYVNRASVLVDRGLREEALEDYTKAIELDPSDVYAWANRAITRIEVGDIAGARSDLDKSEQLDPGFVQNFIARGMLADREGRMDDAVTAYTGTLEVEPDNSYALGQRAKAFIAQGNPRRALLDWTTAIQASPDNGWALMERGNLYLDIRRYDDAIADFSKVIELDPEDSWALANRGMAHVWKQEYDAAGNDLDATQALDKDNPVLWRARGLMALQRGKFKDAVAAFDKSIAQEPGNVFSLGHRAQALHRAGDDAAALRDAQAALALSPRWIDLYLLRANIFTAQGKRDEAVAEAVRIERAVPADPYGHVVAARIFSSFDKNDEAMKAFDRALAIEPSAYIYHNRALSRTRTDIAGRQADLDAALALDPDMIEALGLKGQMELKRGDAQAAIATYSRMVKAAPDMAQFIGLRGIAHFRAGDEAAAKHDFAAAREKTTEPVLFNNLCWDKATEGVALEEALGECDRALAGTPNYPPYLDSRGLVLLRLGRFDDAIADYDKALAASPHLETSLFGRAVARARKGEIDKAQADVTAALKISPKIRDRFEGFGFSLEGVPGGSGSTNAGQ